MLFFDDKLTQRNISVFHNDRCIDKQISLKKIRDKTATDKCFLMYICRVKQIKMRVFKFGGASIKDASAVKNVVRVLQTVGHDNCLLVVSAMGKTTNALETLVHTYFHAPHELTAVLQKIKKEHLEIVAELFENENHPVYENINAYFKEIERFLEHNKSPNYNFVYDQVVSYGELVSSTLLSHYLNQNAISNQWIDARNLIKTDNSNREAIVDWPSTEKEIQRALLPGVLYITQGFIGSDAHRFSTTLGREGSDYSAAIFAYALEANSVTIWKDVPGVLNADPRFFKQTTLLHHISYREAIEMAFYGASVIHPKTVQPLQEKNIPLFVKSFIDPTQKGTEVSKGATLTPHTSLFIVKKNQLLLSISSKDFSFILEENMSAIFKLLGHYKIKVNVIQNSAISFTVCVEDKFDHFEELRKELQTEFNISYNQNVSLYTIRHFTEQALEEVQKNKTILLQQTNRETVQLVVKDFME